MKKLFKVFSLIIAITFAMPIIADNTVIFDEFKVYAEETAKTTDEGEDFVEPEYVPNFTLPNNIKGTYLTPGVDFATDSSASTETLKKEINTVLDKVQSYELNAIIINTSYNDKSYYSTDVNETLTDSPLDLAISLAVERSISVYLTFDINLALKGATEYDLETRINYLALQAHMFTVKYRVDGIILDGYYSKKNTQSYGDYMTYGSGIGYNNWLVDNGGYVFSLISSAIRKTNNAVPVGISINDVWANSSTNSNGSDTNDSFQALTNGYADTLSYVKNGYADFIVLKAEGSLTDKNLPFEKVVNWWNDVATESKIPLYVTHSNEKICTNETGWISPDQIIKQLIKLKNFTSYNGSFFNSFSCLKKNSGSSTTVLVNFFKENINEDAIFKDLTMLTPTKLIFTTYEPKIKFTGTFDPNFEVYFNGKIINLNSLGAFDFDKELDVGLNTFTIKNKANVYTYKVTRKVQILKSIDPTSNMTVDGETTITISAIAYSGSVITANVNGKKITLSEVEGQVDDIDPNSNYAKFVGYYKVPKGIVAKEQDLGRITIYGSYKGFNESMIGGNIKVNSVVESSSGKVIEVISDNTMVYDGKTTGNVPNPLLARLPAGTMEYYKSTSGDYYITDSGKRIKKTSMKVLDEQYIVKNDISDVSSYMNSKGDTVIKLKQGHKTGYSIEYNSLSLNGYAISSFAPEYITIIFDYITSASELPTFQSGSIFSSASWEVKEINGVNKHCLKLRLSNAGIYAGVKPYFDDNGYLIFAFSNYTSGISGKTIVIDPGHGKGSKTPGVFDPGALGNGHREVDINYNLALKLKDKLEAEGANVIMYDTKNVEYYVYKRSDVARQYDPDMYISIHCNAAGSSARGTEVFYFTPFSQPLAKCLTDEISKNFSTNRGAKYDYFVVTTQQEFPSVLIETGFITNEQDANILLNKQNEITNSMVTGIKKFFSRAG